MHVLDDDILNETIMNVLLCWYRHILSFLIFDFLTWPFNSLCLKSLENKEPLSIQTAVSGIILEAIWEDTSDAPRVPDLHTRIKKLFEHRGAEEVEEEEGSKQIFTWSSGTESCEISQWLVQIPLIPLETKESD